MNTFIQNMVNKIRQDLPTELEVTVHKRTQTPLSIKDVLKAVSYLGENRHFVIISILAVYTSTFLDRNDPIWLMIVGNPSSNKTTLVDLLKNLPDVFRLDTMTSNPFSSGQRDKENPKDLLPLLDGKCFVIKEYGTLFGRSDEMVKQLISDLVAIYDGEYSKHSPTRGTVRYNSLFSHIGCVTPMSLSSRQRYMNAVGARFIFLRLPALEQAEREENLAKVWDKSPRRSKSQITDVITQYCYQLKESVKNGLTIEFPDEVKNRINKYALLTARARGIVISERTSFQDEDGKKLNHSEVTDIQVEEPFRALKQLKKFAEALAIVNGSSVVGEDELEIVRLVTLSSMPVRRAEVLRVFESDTHFTAKQAADHLEKNYKTVKRNFDELVALKVLVKNKEENFRANVYSLNQNFIDIFAHNSDQKGLKQEEIDVLFPNPNN